MAMDNSFNKLADVVPERDAWKFLVRVVRMWEVPNFLNPYQVSSVELVLVDECGDKIHATIRKQLLFMFQKKITEGDVYKLLNFTVIPNSGSYRTTNNKYKLMFQMKTKVQPHSSSLIPVHGFSFTKISEIIGHTKDNDILVDVIGVLTGMSAKKEYVRDGKVTKMIVIELTDHSGKCECALFGEYVDDMERLIGKTVGGGPVVVVQFAKVKIFKDKASLQNVMSTTKIFVNPGLPEATNIKEAHAVSGFESSITVLVIEQGGRASVEDDFLRLYPKRTIGELVDMDEDGTFIVFASINGVVMGEDWWYLACKCHKSVAPDSGAYYCKGCDKHVFSMVPRFKVKVDVGDGHNSTIFVLFDSDVQYLLGTQCVTLVAEAKAENGGLYPKEFDNLKGKKLLFKIERSTFGNIAFDGTFRVKRVCSEVDVIDRFVSGFWANFGFVVFLRF